MSLQNNKVVVLLSGGLDSATVLYWAKRRGYRPHALLLDYGQRHCKELECARRLARLAHVPATTVRFNLPWGGSALLDDAARLPQKRSLALMCREIPATYVPARNTIFLGLALSYAESIGARAVCIGANALDFSGYPDCRPAYYQAFQKLAALATKAGVEGKRIVIQTPLLHRTKAQIVRLALRLGVPLKWTWSCYAGGRRPCGVCDSCLLRQKGFTEAGVLDPAQPR